MTDKPRSIQEILDEQRKSSKISLMSDHQINLTISNKEKAQDSEWREKNKKILQDRSKSDDWKQKHATAMKAKFDDPDYVEKHAKAMKARNNNLEFLSVIKDLSKKPIKTPYGIFKSITAAGEYEQLYHNKKFNPNRFTKLLKTPNSGYYYISKEEYQMLTGDQNA